MHFDELVCRYEGVVQSWSPFWSFLTGGRVESGKIDKKLINVMFRQEVLHTSKVNRCQKIVSVYE